MALQYNYSSQVQSGGDKSTLDSITQNEFVLLGITRSNGSPITLDANALRKESIEAIVASKVQSMLGNQSPINWLKSQLGNAGISTSVNGANLTRTTQVDIQGDLNIHDEDDESHVVINATNVSGIEHLNIDEAVYVPSLYGTGTIQGKDVKGTATASAPAITGSTATLSTSVSAPSITGDNATLTGKVKGAQIEGTSYVQGKVVKIENDDVILFQDDQDGLLNVNASAYIDGGVQMTGQLEVENGSILHSEVKLYSDLVFKESASGQNESRFKFSSQNDQLTLVGDIYFDGNIHVENNIDLGVDRHGDYGVRLYFTEDAHSNYLTISGDVDCSGQIDAAYGFYEQ